MRCGLGNLFVISELNSDNIMTKYQLQKAFMHRQGAKIVVSFRKLCAGGETLDRVTEMNFSQTAPQLGARGKPLGNLGLEAAIPSLLKNLANAAKLDCVRDVTVACSEPTVI